jgi:hypothetical protein
LRLVVDFFAYAARLGASAHRAACCRLLGLRCASGCLDTSRGSSRGSLSTTSPRAGSSLSISPTPRVRVPRHVMRLVVDYFALRRRVVDYFAYVARPGASTRHAARRAAHRRLFLLRRASGCLITSRRPSLTTSPTPCVRVPRHVPQLVIDYFVSRRLVVEFFTYAARSAASARRAAHRRLLLLAQARRRLLRLRRSSGCLGTSCGSSSTTSCRAARRRLLCLVQARRRLLHLRRASRCLGTLQGSSSTTLTTPRVRVPRHVARL